MDQVQQERKVLATLVSSEHGFDDYEVSGIECVHRITVGRGIKRGDLCNVYCADSVKLGAPWQGNVEATLSRFLATHQADNGGASQEGENHESASACSTSVTQTQPLIRIKFRRHDGTIAEDAIRGFFNHEALLEPYARNTVAPAAVLVEHSWIHLSDIVEFLADPHQDEDESCESEEQENDNQQIAGAAQVDSVSFDVANGRLAGVTATKHTQSDANHA